MSQQVFEKYLRISSMNAWLLSLAAFDCGWCEDVIDNLVPVDFHSVCQNVEVNLGSRSEMMFLGRPWSLKMCCIYIEAVC
jgi:hypothetical protein